MRSIWNRSLFVGASALAFAPCAFLHVGCGSSGGGFGEPPPIPMFGGDAALVDAPPCASQVTCSRDGKRVLNGCGTLLQTCAPSEGCSVGECFDACAAVASGSSSVGCDFFTAQPAPFTRTNENSEGSCFAAFVANTWDIPTRLEADYQGLPINVARAGRLMKENADGTFSYTPLLGDLMPGQVAVLFLSEGVSKSSYHIKCPVGTDPAITGYTALPETGVAKGFRIRSSAPVSAYSIYPFGGADSFIPSASLMLPTSTLKTDYVMVTVAPQELDGAGSTSQIIGTDMDTQVTIVPSAAIVARGKVEGTERGVAHTWLLQKQDVLQFVQQEELVGSFLSSTKPVAVFGGSQCFNFLTRACDSEQQQLFPLAAWTNVVAAAPYSARSGLETRFYWRVVAAADGTALTYEGGNSTDAPTRLARGQAATFSTDGAFVVRSQDEAHPIWLFEYMAGGQNYGSEGDANFVNVIPPGQFLGNYRFVVDPSFRNSELVVIRQKEKGTYQPVTLDCVGSLTDWKSLGTSDLYQFTRVAITRVAKPVGKCNAGPHSMDSEGPFGVTVWGTDSAASYAYPGGAAIRTLTDVKTLLR
jgi:IgGFc binding protein